MADLLKFKKPSTLARLQLPNPETRKGMLEAMLNMVAEAEKEPDFVGYAVVILCNDGRRRSVWNSTWGAGAQLSRQLRREAASIVKEFRTVEFPK